MTEAIVRTVPEKRVVVTRDVPITWIFRDPKVRMELLKEVIQPQVPLRLPCYDFTPITGLTLRTYLPKVSTAISGLTSFRGVTGGVYKARERIHRVMLLRDY